MYKTKVKESDFLNRFSAVKFIAYAGNNSFYTMPIVYSNATRSIPG